MNLKKGGKRMEKKIKEEVKELIAKARELTNQKEFFEALEILKQGERIIMENEANIKRELFFALWAEICHARATVFQGMQEFQEAEKELKRALEKRQRIKDVKGIAYTSFELFILSKIAGKPTPVWWEESRRALIAALLLPESDYHKGNFLQNLAFLHQSISDYYRALQLYSSALIIKEKAKDERGKGLTYARIAECHLALGNEKSAREYAGLAMEIFKKINDQQRIDQVKNNVLSKL
jgi:tetratricopeptide (TPR) repeat protein